MAVKFLDVRVAQVWVDANPLALHGTAGGAVPDIGISHRYPLLFEAVAKAGEDLSRTRLPWHGDAPHSNRFWKKYLGDMLAADRAEWGQFGWTHLVPMKLALPLPRLSLGAQQTRSFCEALAWPCGTGFSWNAWLQAPMTVDALADTLDLLVEGDLDCTWPDGKADRLRLKTLGHRILDSVQEHAFGSATPQGLRPEPLTIVTIVRAAVDPSSQDPLADDLAAALQVLRTRLVQASGGPLAAIDPVATDDARQDTIWMGKRLRLVWFPTAFLAEKRLHRNGCFHRNLLQSSLQTLALASGVDRLARLHEQTGSLDGDLGSCARNIERQLDRIDQDIGYSGPFLTALIDRGDVKAARARLKSL